MNKAPDAPLRRLVPLTLVVLLAHLAVLRQSSDILVPPGAETVRSFSTRILAPPPSPSTEISAAPAPAATPRSAVAPTLRPAPAPHATEAPSKPELAERTLTPPAPPGPEATVAAAPTAPPLPANPSSLPQLALPAPARFKYEVVASRYGVSLRGEAELHWSHDGEQYEARLEVRSPLLPPRSERSVGRIGQGGLAPSYYAQKSRGEQAAHFEREKGRITFSNNRPSAELALGMQDRLSVVLQVAMLIGGDPGRFPAGTELAIPTATTREAETWIFSVEGEEDLQLPGGAVRAVKVQRKPRKEFDQKVELWLAPRMDYAPVRLRLTNSNGDTVDQRWASTDKG